MTVPQAFDSLIAKLIVTGASRQQALERARRALDEFVVSGMPTVLPFHRAVVRDPAFTAEPFTIHTRWIETEFAGQLPSFSGLAAQEIEPPPRERITVEVAGKRLEVVLPAGLLAAGPGGAGPGGAGRPAQGRRPGDRQPKQRRDQGGRSAAGRADGDDLVSPMQGTIIKIVAREGDRVAAGDTVVVLEAMKMEQPLTAHKDGTVTGLAVEIGQTISAGGIVCQLKD
jgi:acetyl-CoA/propionyl-CoA carboxylase biotin carboxyl carrier protein